MKRLYKNELAKSRLMELYDEKLRSLNIDYEQIDVQTSYGRTRIIKTGNESGKPVVLFHGINAGAPLTIEAVKGLCPDYLIYAIDTIGQATKSEENRIDINDDSFAVWADETLEQLGIQGASFIGVSYGAYILQKLITHRPARVEKCIMVVPGGLVNGAIGASMIKLTFPLLRFLLTKRDDHLRSFIKSFVPESDDFMFRLQRALLTGLNMDYRRPVLLQKKDVEHFTAPVYMIVADDDVFFPGDQTIKRAQSLFQNLKETYVLKDCMHMPAVDRYPEIQQQLRAYIG
jgi:pimeloyl-ACP methyl ester carboxylesterase